MRNDPSRRVARLDRGALADLPFLATDQERGQHLWRLFWERGLDPDRLYAVEYHPCHACWLLLQCTKPGPRSAPAVPAGRAAAQFYVEAMLLLRRTARTAFAAQAAQSSTFARYGCPPEKVPRPQELTPDDLTQLLGGPGEESLGVCFDAEGGWRARPSAN